LSKTYRAERIIANPDNRYTLRAEYRIGEQGNLRNMSIATAVSFIASLIIIIVLFLLIRSLKRRHNEIVEMERSFHGAIHDLKSPLAFVYLSLSSMEEEEANPHIKMNLTLSADRILFLSDKIKRTMQSGRNINKITEKEKQKMYVFDIIEQIETEIKAMFSEKEIQFENVISSELAVRVLADLFEAALRTLIENAVKYNNNTPVVKIAAIHNMNTIQFMIEDNGIGIPLRQQKRLFRPYYTSDKKDGTGIGLYYAQRIVKAHGGFISVKSKMGKGSLFIITIPS
jgi:signal transduction histidine kinase